MKDEKKTPNKNEESFAYDGGIGDPDKAWEKNMEIDGEPMDKTKKPSEEEEGKKKQ